MERQDQIEQCYLEMLAHAMYVLILIVIELLQYQ